MHGFSRPGFWVLKLFEKTLFIAKVCFLLDIPERIMGSENNSSWPNR